MFRALSQLVVAAAAARRGPQVRVPHDDLEHDALVAAVVVRLVLEAVVEHERLALPPRARLVGHAQHRARAALPEKSQSELVLSKGMSLTLCAPTLRSSSSYKGAEI